MILGFHVRQSMTSFGPVICLLCHVASGSAASVAVMLCLGHRAVRQVDLQSMLSVPRGHPSVVWPPNQED